MQAEKHQFRGVRILFLPKPRRSRHPYQWACVGALFFYATFNLILGPASHSPLLHVGAADISWLNWSLALGSALCLVAMIIPDNYWRLFVELSGHLLLVFTMTTFGVVAGNGIMVEPGGLSLNLIMAVAVVIAALCRCAEITRTIRQTWFKPDCVGAIVHGASITNQSRK